MENVKVTVVMPVLNGMPYIKEALDSVRKQTLKELEILVVDAGSTDGTCEYVTDCTKSDERVKLVLSSKKSMGLQYNMGITLASGQYVGFCESDDYLEFNMLEVLYGEAVKNGLPDTVKSEFSLFIRKNGEEYDLNYRILPGRKKSLYGKVISLEDNGDIFLRDIYMWYGIYRRDFLIDNKIALNETPGAAFQDGGFIQQVNMMARRQIYLPMRFYHYRRDNVNSSVYKKETSLFSLREAKYVIDWLKEHPKLKKKFVWMTLERMVCQFFIWLYIKDIYQYGEVSYIEELHEFRAELLQLVEEMSYPERQRIINNHLVYLFLYDLEGLNDWAKIDGKIAHYRLCEYKSFIIDKSEIVIVTAGMRGRAICAFLLKNDWDGKIVFCDNDEKLQGKTIMGRAVYSFSEAVEKYPNAVYIANPALYDDLYFQLIKEGIPAAQIVLPPFADAHGCTGTKW